MAHDVEYELCEPFDIDDGQLFGPDGCTGRRQIEQTPWGNKIDGTLCPQKINQAEGVVAHDQKDGWTAIAFWDRSVDSRFGSNSAFLIHAEVSAEEAWRLAKERFPQVCARFKFPIKLLSAEPAA